MTVNLTGPNNCAECGTSTPIEVALAGDAGPFVFTIEGVRIEVPGLYVCTSCAGAIMVGEKQSGVTYADAAMFLAETYVPLAIMWLERNQGDPLWNDSLVRVKQAVECAEILAMASLLDAMEKAAEEEGCAPEDMALIPMLEDDEPHPRDMASLN
jgi:hypothetical protein